MQSRTFLIAILSSTLFLTNAFADAGIPANVNPGVVNSAGESNTANQAPTENPNAAANQAPAPAQPFDESRWDGMNLGVQLGEAWNQTDWTYKNANYFNTIGPTYLGSNFDSSSSGITGGAYIGYIVQVNPILLGIEASFLGADLNTSFDNPFLESDMYIANYTAKIQDFGTVKGRISYPLDRWLFSFDAGWAGGTMVLTIEDPINHVKANTSDWVNGWTIGAGIDYRLLKRLSLGVAYDFIGMNMNDATIPCAACGSGVGFGEPDVTGKSNTQMLTARLTYFLGS